MRVLVITVVHHPFDARVYARQIRTLVDAGHDITYAAPWSSYEVAPPDGIHAEDLPRAHRTRRLAAWSAARRLLRRQAPDHDVVLLHNPELLVPALTVRGLPPIVWDVHEDPAAALSDKSYLPALTRAPLGAVVRGVERVAERRLHLLLAEEGYADRFRRAHPVVPNEPIVPETVPPPGARRVVYLGRISEGRGARELIALADRLPAGVVLELYGWAEADVEPLLRAAHERGALAWHGRVGNDEALRRLDGALAGLSLLHDLPNYRHSRPTKVVEYMARGVPVVSTPLPVAVDIIERHGCGLVVPFGDVDATAGAIARLHADHALRERLGAAGHTAAVAHYNWTVSGARFVAELQELAA